MGRPDAGDEPAKILVVDDDHDTADLMHAILTDEGYAPAVIYDAGGAAVRAAVDRVDPACVLLDSTPTDPNGYGESWQTAAWIADRTPTISVIMMTAHVAVAKEALAALTKRARAADFAAVVQKPFDVDDFLATLDRALRRGSDRRAVEAEVAARTVELRERLIAAGAQRITTSSRRVWATFTGDSDAVLQIYRWERMSTYLVGRYSADGAKLEPLGQFTDVAAAIAIALPEDDDSR